VKVGKIRYKRPSEIFEKNSSKNENSSLRVSIGKDQDIKEYYYLILNVYLKRILLLDISLI
jgi:hypothetical protein